MADEEFRPTRTRLKALKETLRLSRTGHNLLEEKNEALILEYFSMSKDMKKKRDDMEKKTSDAFTELEKAQETLGHIETKYLGASVKESHPVEIENKKIMGVPLLKINTPDYSRDILERGYNITDSNMFLDETAKLFEESAPLILKVGEIESNTKLLKTEIAKTRHKVTALEDFVIPSLKSGINQIDAKLEERSREDFVRTKKVKKYQTRISL